jgi:hypothetical protein
MYNSRDFPDRITEAAWIRERHGPPPDTPEQAAAREVARRETEERIAEMRKSGASLRSIADAFPQETLYRVRMVVAQCSFQEKFPDRATVRTFLVDVHRTLCDECSAAYLSGPWRSWGLGKRLSFPELPTCDHEKRAE